MQKRILISLFVATISLLLFGCEIQPVRPVATTTPQTLPFDWPISPLTEEQLQAVRECDIEALATERYPDALAAEELLDSYAPETDCDWAVLAVAHAYRRVEGTPLSPAAEEAFTKAILGNPGFMFATMVFYGYFDAPPIVEPPDFAQQEISEVRLKYAWGGLGEVVEYSLDIRQAITEPVVISTDITDTLIIDKPAVQALTAALGNFMPVDSKFDMVPCSDNYPNWSVDLTFADETEVNLSTASNFMYVGGPWFMEIEEQVYVQVSPAFAVAVATLIDSLGLTLGQPAALTCFPQPFFDSAFP